MVSSRPVDLTGRYVSEFYFMKKSRDDLAALAMGISLGAAFGLLAGNMLLGVSVGIVFGLLIPMLRSERHKDR